MADIPRIAFLVIVGFCIGTVAIGLSAQSLFKPTTSTITDFQTTTQTSTLTSTLTDLQSATVTSTSVSTATSTYVTTYVSTLSASDGTSYVTVTSTSVSSTTMTSTVTSVSTATVTSTVTSVQNDSSTTLNTDWLTELTGNSTQSTTFTSPSTTLIIAGDISGTGSANIQWFLDLASSGNTVAQGSLPGGSSFSLTVQGVQSGQGYLLEVIGDNVSYQIAVYPPS